MVKGLANISCWLKLHQKHVYTMWKKEAIKLTYLIAFNVKLLRGQLGSWVILKS